MPFSAFCIPLYIGACHTVGAYSTSKPPPLANSHYRIVTPSAQVISKVTYGYAKVHRFQLCMFRVDLALLVKC